MDTHASCSRCARAVPGTQNAAIEIRTQNTPETETRARREDGKVLVASFMPATEVFQSSSRGADGRARRLGDCTRSRLLVHALCVRDTSLRARKERETRTITE